MPEVPVGATQIVENTTLVTVTTGAEEAIWPARIADSIIVFCIFLVACEER